MSDTLATNATQILPEPPRPPKKKPFYLTLWGQVLIGVAVAIVYGYLRPESAAKMKPLGDGFIRLITMVITVIIFCTVVSGIAGMENLKKVGRIGGKALLYFEIVSTLALFAGMLVGNLSHPGAGFNVNPATLDAKSVARLRRSRETAERDRLPDEHYSDHHGGRFRAREYSAGAAGGDPVRLRAVADRRKGQTGRRVFRFPDSGGLQHRQHADVARAHRRFWRDGLYRGPLRNCVARPAGKIDRDVLCDLHSLRAGGHGRDRLGFGFQHHYNSCSLSKKKSSSCWPPAPRTRLCPR